MNINALGDALSVSPQIFISDLQEIATQGFRTLVCNRPDGEASDQPVFDEIRNAAEAHGLKAAYLPVTPGKAMDGDVADFSNAIKNLPGPVLAYCRTGMRSVTLWAKANPERLDPEQVLRIASDAGYDMSAVLGLSAAGQFTASVHKSEFDVVIVGTGAGRG
jgi:sulfide:quinone oxidoreductase